MEQRGYPSKRRITRSIRNIPTPIYIVFTNAKLHRDISQAQYHAWPSNQQTERGAPDWCVSRSDLLYVVEDCGEMFLAGGRDVAGNDSIRTGSLVDCLLTTPAAFEADYAVQPQTYAKEVTKGRGDKKTTTTVEMPWTNQSNTCRAWADEQRKAGRQVISYKQYREAQDIAQAVRHKQPAWNSAITLGQLIDACEGQLVVSATWTEDGVEVPCRCMIDLARGIDGDQMPILYDLKTSQECKPRKFAYSIRDYGYDIQAWMYSSMVAAAIGYEGPIRFGFIVVRNTKPFLVATYVCSEGTLRAGETRFRDAMGAYVAGLKNGFAGYTTGFEEI